MWHASVAPVRQRFPAAVGEQLARLELEGVGDARLGEWVERTRVAVHVRRRLSAAEQVVVGPVVDVRGTAEAHQRFATMVNLLPVGWEPMAADERDGR